MNLNVLDMCLEILPYLDIISAEMPLSVMPVTSKWPQDISLTSIFKLEFKKSELHSSSSVVAGMQT